MGLNCESVGPRARNNQFPAIPIVTSIITSIKGFVDQRHLNERLNHIEESIYKIEENHYHTIAEQVTSFIPERIEKLNSHDYYSLKRDLRFLIADASPELVDTFVSALLDFLHDTNVNHTMAEEVMDILLQFNAHDIDLMEKVEEYRNSRYQIEDENDEKRVTNEDKSISVIMGFKWDEFAEYLGYKGKTLHDALTGGAYKIADGEYSYDFSFLGRSLLKLQSLGVFDLAFKMYVGSSSLTDIENVSITQFGNEILKHVAFANGWPQRANPDAILVAR